MHNVASIWARFRASRPAATLTILLVAAMLAACGSINVKGMTPDLSDRGYAPSKLTLRVEPVLAEYRKVGFVSADEMRETVIAAFRKANLYGAVITEGPADLVLYVEFVHLKFLDATDQGFGNQNLGSLRMEAIVRYELVESASRTNVWNDLIRSIAGSNKIGGGRGVAEAVTGAVRENVKAMVVSVADRGPRTTR